MYDWLYSCYRLLCDLSLITNQTVIMQVINEEMAGLGFLKIEARPPSNLALGSSTSSSLVRSCLEELSFLVVTGYKGKAL